MYRRALMPRTNVITPSVFPPRVVTRLQANLGDLQRLIRFIERRRAQLLEAGEASDRRAVDATILLSKLWVAVMNLRLRASDGS